MTHVRCRAFALPRKPSGRQRARTQSSTAHSWMQCAEGKRGHDARRGACAARIMWLQMHAILAYAFIITPRSNDSHLHFVIHKHDKNDFFNPELLPSSTPRAGATLPVARRRAGPRCITLRTPGAWRRCGCCSRRGQTWRPRRCVLRTSWCDRRRRISGNELRTRGQGVRDAGRGGDVTSAAEGWRRCGMCE